MSCLKPTIHKHNVSEVQERWGVSSNFQLEKAQPFHGIPAFRVRGHPSPSRHCTTDGLDVQDRSKECLLDGTTSSKRQTLVSVHLGKQTVPIQSVAFRTGASAQVVHKTNETSSGVIEKIGNEECDLHGRSLGWRSDDGRSSFSSSPDKETSRIFGVCSERGEVSHIPTKDCRVSGFHSGLRAHDTDATKTEDLKNSASLQGSAQQTQNISEGSSESSRPISGSSKSSITSPLTLQTATNGSNISTAKESTKIQCTNDPQQREQRRATTVDRELRRLEWQIIHQDSNSKQARDRDRRIQQRMGSHLQRNNNTRQMDPTGNKTPYQRKGVTHSVNSCESFHKGESRLSCPSENGQHNDSSTNCEDGLNEIQKSLQVDHRSVGILLAEQHHTDSGTSKGSFKCESRSRIEGFQGLQQLKTETPDLPDNNQDMGASGDRFICGQDKLPIEEISWKPDPLAIATDAFTVNWTEIKGYAFPLICLINKCLNKVWEEQTQLIIITPTWQGQPWYARLLQMSIEDPILLPQMQDLLKGPTEENHPLVMANAMTIAAWKVSGKMPEIQSYQRGLKPCWNKNSLLELGRLTRAPGRGGVAGAINNCWIPFQPLWRM